MFSEDEIACTAKFECQYSTWDLKARHLSLTPTQTIKESTFSCTNYWYKIVQSLLLELVIVTQNNLNRNITYFIYIMIYKFKNKFIHLMG